MNIVWGLLLFSVVGNYVYFFLLRYLKSVVTGHLSWWFLEISGTLIISVILLWKTYLLADQLHTGILTNKLIWHTLNLWLRKYASSANLGGVIWYSSRNCKSSQFTPMYSEPFTHISLCAGICLCEKESYILICSMNCFLLRKYFPHCLFNWGRKREIFS